MFFCSIFNIFYVSEKNLPRHRLTITHRGLELQGSFHEEATVEPTQAEPELTQAEPEPPTIEPSIQAEPQLVEPAPEVSSSSFFTVSVLKNILGRVATVIITQLKHGS